MDMRLSVGLLLRLGIVLATVCLCIHVYLDTGWQAALAPLVLGHPTQSNKSWGQHSRLKVVSTEEREQNKSIKRKTSHGHTPKRGSLAERREEDKQDGLSQCCPPVHPRRKVSLIYLKLICS